MFKIPLSNFKVHYLHLEHCYLQETSSTFWMSLTLFTSLHQLDIQWSNVLLLDRISIPTVKILIAVGLDRQSYNTLIASLSGLEKVVLRPEFPNADINNIAEGLRVTGRSLIEINLECPCKTRCELSHATMTTVCEIISHFTPRLTGVGLSNLNINDESLTSFIETCREKNTMRHIT